jgi:O-antigen/teichoic acid export membrane protein
MHITPFLCDLALTATTSLVTVVASLILTRVLAVQIGPEEFGAYTTSCRVVATSYPLSTLSTGVALARYIGLQAAREGSFAGHLCGALVLTCAATGVVVLALLAAPATFSAWFFGDSAHAGLIAAIAFMVVGSGLHSVAYACYCRPIQAVPRCRPAQTQTMMALSGGAR